MAEVVANNTQKEKTTNTVERGSRELGPQPLGLGPEAGLLSLQASVGNRAVGKFLESMSQSSPASGVLVQRKCTSCGQAASKCSGCRDEETIQRKANSGNGAAPDVGAVPAAVHQALDSRGGRSIDPTVRGMLESRFNYNFGHVRVHHDALANRAAASINAAAFTVGNSIWFGQGQYQTGTNRGLHLLAHELAHTIQQRRHAGPLQGRLTVGSVHDSAEAAADRAADAVLKNGSVPSLAAGLPILRRQPLPFTDPNSAAIQRAIPIISNTDDPDTVAVEYQGNNYRATRRLTGWRRTCERVEANEAPRLSADFDSSNAWAQVEWCTVGGRSTRGRVRLGVDIPAALARTIGSLVRGGQDPRTVLSNTDLTPFIEVDVARSGQVRVRARAEATVRPGREEVRGGRGSLAIDLPGATIEFEIRGSAPDAPGGRPDIQGGLVVTIPFGTRSQPVRCREVEVCRYTPTYSIQCIQRIPPRTQRLPDETRYLYFEYATDVVATRDSTTGRNRRTENNRGAERNESEIPRIQQLFDQGWKVNSIRGFTSPEGPREGPSQQRRQESRFVGNTQLSQNRAVAAQRQVETLCNPNGMLTMRQRTCFDGTVTPTGEGELLTADTASGREMEGTPLATQAAGRFPTEERSQSTPQIEEQLGTARPGQRGSLVYPFLRRATITFMKTETIAGRDTEPGPCSPEIERDVRTFFENRPRRRGER
ncbi:MAG: DUF4157 domain-containing protein [Pyrinomonadaceae bacterium]|nr:DUF4157 domain-containing protein [Pyrinomonadaceae bacterium]